MSTLRVTRTLQPRYSPSRAVSSWGHRQPSRYSNFSISATRASRGRSLPTIHLSSMETTNWSSLKGHTLDETVAPLSPATRLWRRAIKTSAAAARHENHELYRTERDTFGEIKVPAEKYWGAQTQR